MPEVLAPTALCSDEDVRSYLGIKPADLTDEDRDTIIRLCNAASETYTAESQRIWKEDDTAGTLRRYAITDAEIAATSLKIDDCTAVNSVGVVGAASVTPFATTSWYTLTLEPDQPITRIWWDASVALQSRSLIEVDADWGWPYVPEKVRQDVIYTASEWYARDVEKFSATFSIDQGRILLPQVLPSQVQANAESWRRWRLA
jgi:hypothetical protein